MHCFISIEKYKLNFFNRQYGQSQSAANANAYNQQFGPNGFGASAANAGAQGFQSQGPLGKVYIWFLNHDFKIWRLTSSLIISKNLVWSSSEQRRSKFY